MLKEDLKNINTSKKELKKFGLTVGTVFSAIGLFIWLYHHSNVGIYITVFGALLIILGAAYSKILKPIYKLWMSAALVMGFFMSRLILTILFYVIVTPIAFLAKIFGKDFLDQKLDKGKGSYWNYRTKEEYQKVFTERQF